jgi:glycosyltransferase involved in cell wall biosynthesis
VTPTRLAVVIPAHNEEKLLPGCLRSVLACRAPVPLEVIVVADACTDSSAELAAAGGATVVRVAARNVGRARAAGVEHALRSGPDGLWLATTDADSRVPPHWLRWHLQWGRRGADLLAGTVTVEDWSSWPADLPARYELRYRAPALHAHGANMGFAATAYRVAGGFPAVRHSEDVALLTRVRQAGGRIVADSSCPVVTSARPLARAPHGFAAHLAALTAPPTVPAG